MLKDTEKIKEEAFSQNIERSTSALDLILSDIDTLSLILFESFAKTNNHFQIAEKISQAFQIYIEKIESCLSGDDKELSFWAATLIVHYRIKNELAENILLQQVISGSPEKAYTATTILCRTKVAGVGRAITERLSVAQLDISMKAFLEEKLSGLNLQETS
jgi:hypothetical protein